MYRVQPGRGVITLPHRGWAVVSTGPAGLPFSRTSPSTGPPGSRRVLTCEGYRTPCSAASRAVFLWPGAIIIALLASRTLMSCAPPPASWGRGALFLHGKGLCVTLFYSPLQNAPTHREHLPRTSGRAGQEVRWRSATPFAYPRCVLAGPLMAYRRGGCGARWRRPLGRTSPGAPIVDRRTPCTIAKETSL